METRDIRRKFLNYFKKQQHVILPSSSVIPHDDPTLLFTNAGMNQFKDVFLGSSKRDYNKAATSQKCIRAGGKHNDLENVGHTTRHLTFFEMLGNFSFGDYFKKDAIRMAFEVSTEVFEFPVEKLWPTVFREDEESYELWKLYVPEKRITRMGEKDNFWMMGETGPCGPCSELLFDRGVNYGNATNPAEDLSGERFLEFWNLVFMQFNRLPGGKQEILPKPSIDTGAGLERVVSLKMGVDNVFDTDILKSLIDQVAEVSKIPYRADDPIKAPAFRVIADHLRCLAFAIGDGAQPSNVERGYVLRKVLRRAVRYGKVLGFDEPFLGKILPRLIETMGEDYPELEKGKHRIQELLTNEEESFFKTLRRGGNLLNQVIENASKVNRKISGDDAFKLKDTYGLPLDEIVLIAKDAELTLDLERYNQLETEAKERSKNAKKSTMQVASMNLFSDFVHKEGISQFVGYDTCDCQAVVKGLIVNEQFVESLQADDEGIIILDKTPFYAEMGGQVGDIGLIEGHNFLFEVQDCKAPFKEVIAHVGKVKQGAIHVGDTVHAQVNVQRRHKIANNHTATHIMHWALGRVLGEHIKQAGSVVDPQRLRFDFSHHKALTEDEIKQVEDLVNERIRENLPVKSYQLPYEDAKVKQEIKQFFGEKYDSIVRVIDIDFSKELCGGIHVSSSGSIGYFRIAKESSIAAGMRRIEAVTGSEAEAFAKISDTDLKELADTLKVPVTKLKEKVKKLMEDNSALEQELKAFKKNQIKALSNDLLKGIDLQKPLPYLVKELTLTPEEMRLCADELMEKLSTGVIVLGVKVADDKCHLIARVSLDVTKKGLSALDLIKQIAPIIEGSGGGKDNMAQAGGKAPQKLSEALSQAAIFIGNFKGP